MKNFKLFMILFIGIAISTSYSCTKKDDSTDDDSSGGDSGKTCYLKKELNDDGSYTTVDYNSKNQAINEKEYDDVGDVETSYEFTYANDRVVKIEIYESGALGSRFEYSYDANGKPEKADLYIDQNGVMVKVGTYNYEFFGDELKKMSMSMDIAGQTIEVSKSEYTYSGGNVVKRKMYSFDMQTQQMLLDKNEKYSYDTKINPYHGIGVDYLMGKPQFLSKANPLKITVTDDKGVVMQDESYNYFYEYNTNKYPSKVNVNSFDNSDANVSTFEYDCN